MQPVLVKPFAYLLELEDGCYYVGITYNLNMRYAQHRDGQGAQWTKLHKPIKLKRVWTDIDSTLENRLTLRYMRKYGWKNVRGGSYCKINIKKPDIL